MARIRTISKSSGTGSAHPTETDAEWSVVFGQGEVLLQLSTFGSDHRQSGPKVSQTIQLRREVALELRDAINQTFPD